MLQGDIMSLTPEGNNLNLKYHKRIIKVDLLMILEQEYKNEDKVECAT